MPTDPKVMDPVPDPPALEGGFGLDAEASSAEADTSADDEEN
jgi:hypothetical protein